MLRIAVVLGSTRPSRVGRTVADWVLDVAGKRTDAKYELIDVAALGPPFLDEALPVLVENSVSGSGLDFHAAGRVLVE